GSETSRWTETSPRPFKCTLPAEWQRPESSARRSHALRGLIAASSCLRSSDSDTFEREQTPLVVETEQAVRAEAVGGDDAMARRNETEAVASTECSGRPLRARIPR